MSAHSQGFPPKDVLLLLRLEGLAVAVAAIAAYQIIGGNWWLFAALILAPDLAFVAYVAGGKVGGRIYNLAHTYTAPALLGGIALLAGWTVLVPVAVIWVAHIGADRALGYGLKYVNVSQATHLGWIGKAGKRGEFVADAR